MRGGQRVLFHKKPRKTNNKVVVDRNSKRRSAAGHDYYIKWVRRHHHLPVRSILVLSLIIVLCCISCIYLPFLWLHQLSTVVTTTGGEKHSQYLNDIITHNNNNQTVPSTAIFVNSTQNNISCKSHGSSSSSLVILVLSARDNHDRRQAIRDTWGLTNHHSIYFVLGGVDNDNNNNSNNVNDGIIEKEMAVYQDLIIDTTHPDSYQSLPHKVKYGLQWIVLHHRNRRCPTTTIEWILKADDDIYLHVDSLEASLSFSFPHQGKKSSDNMVVLGRIQRNRVVQHFGKWAENTNEYHGIVYPPWPLGSCGYVMNLPVAMWIVDHYESLSEKYQGEDTSLGIWLEDIQENITWIHAPRQFVADGNCQTNTDALVIGHKMTTAHLHQCYDLHQQQPLRVFDLLLSNNNSSSSTHHHDAADNNNNEPVVNNAWEIQMAKDRQARKSKLEDRKKKEARRRQEREEKRRRKEGKKHH